ncbi:unnamed protein product [Leptidea sinapis]|uniref:Reelin domain-containing protein n=1 Tax=Leptidea sinapis TaxID=189913 RepID=A0A5E4PMA3_9NEOP|nr:unnamed protein product [Leptidea sinapis]
MLPRKRSTKLLLIAVLCLVQSSEQHGSGAPPGACLDQIPRHSTILPQASVPPYAIITSSAQVRQGDALNVTIGSPFTTPLPIGGFILQARSIQDTDKIIGKFTGVPTVAQIMSCRGDNDTVTHTSPQEKPPLTFTWVAPNDYLGGVEFRATVAQSYATFWKNVESTLVEVVTPDTVITTSSPVTTTARTTQAPPVIMESKPNTTPPPLDSIYQGCADTKLCFGVPQNCIPTGYCKAIVAIFVAGDIYTFEIQGTDNPKYVSAALSMDNKMGDDSAMECVRNDNGRVNLFTSWTYPKVEPYVKRSDSPQDIVQLLESSTIDGKLYCKFRRDTVSKVMGQTFDLARNKYNLMVVSGDSMKATGEPLALSTVGTAAASSKLLLKLHGSFMIAAWIGTASLGILLARYFRKTWVGKTFGGKDIWFANTDGGDVATDRGRVHPDSSGGGRLDWYWRQPSRDYGDCYSGAYFRPHPGTNKRPIFNWAHWLLGNSAHILGTSTFSLPLYSPASRSICWVYTRRSYYCL